MSYGIPKLTKTVLTHSANGTIFYMEGSGSSRAEGIAVHHRHTNYLDNLIFVSSICQSKTDVVPRRRQGTNSSIFIRVYVEPVQRDIMKLLDSSI